MAKPQLTILATLRRNNMAVNKVDPDAKTPTTKTMPYGGDKAQASDSQEPVNNPQVTHLGPDVGAIPPPEYNSPSVHELAVQGAEEAFGPDAHNNPGFDAYVKDREDQINETLKRTQG